MKKILVADDSLDVRFVIKEFFESHKDGYVVEEAKDGLQALEKLGVGEFDLVISDIEMPGMTGLELVGKIKERFPQLPVILMSGAFEAYKKTVFALGVNGFFAKPFNLQSVELEVQRVLES